jgi:hypothetical protein
MLSEFLCSSLQKDLSKTITYGISNDLCLDKTGGLYRQVDCKAVARLTVLAVWNLRIAIMWEKDSLQNGDRSKIIFLRTIHTRKHGHLWNRDTSVLYQGCPYFTGFTVLTDNPKARQIRGYPPLIDRVYVLSMTYLCPVVNSFPRTTNKEDELVWTIALA